MSKDTQRKAPASVVHLANDYEFTVLADPKNSDIDFIKFDDGREYKLQHPTFLELHEAVMADGNADHQLFLIGLENLYPLNEQSKKINEEYLNKNREDGLFLWSPLVRGLLQSR